MHVSNRRLFLTVEPRERRDESGEFPVFTPMLIAFGIKPFSVFLMRFRRISARTRLDDGSIRDHFQTSSVELSFNCGANPMHHVDLVLSVRPRPRLKLRAA